MKTAKAYIARSSMLTEYLRYMWSRPRHARISVENFTLPRPAPVPVTFPRVPDRRSTLGETPARRAIFDRPEGFRRTFRQGILGLLVMALWLAILGARQAHAQANPCPETNVLKFIQAPNLDGGFDLWDTGPWALADDFQCTNTGPITDIHLWGGWLNDIVDF